MRGQAGVDVAAGLAAALGFARDRRRDAERRGAGRTAFGFPARPDPPRRTAGFARSSAPPSSARFRAALAAFLVSFASLRARFSATLATRSTSFAAAALALAFSASAVSDCNAAALSASFAEFLVFATVVSPSERGLESLSPCRSCCHQSLMAARAARNARISATSAGHTECGIG